MLQHWKFAAAALLCLTAACTNDASRPGADPAAGDPEQGKAAIDRYACGSCHAIPGIQGASGKLAPSLAGFAGKPTFAGGAKNDLDTLVRYIQKPQEVHPGTTMPPLNVSAKDARDIAAYLQTLR